MRTESELEKTLSRIKDSLELLFRVRLDLRKGSPVGLNKLKFKHYGNCSREDYDCRQLGLQLRWRRSLESCQ